MIEYMLADVICDAFEKKVGKTCHESGKALHVGFDMRRGNMTDQYRVCHMYLHAPGNYVHVAIQEERIDKNSKRHVKPMELLCYHDSCWRDAVQTFIFKNRAEISMFKSLGSLFDWCDVLTLSQSEMDYRHQLVRLRDAWGVHREAERKQIAEKLKVNPFDERSLWRLK